MRLRIAVHGVITVIGIGSASRAAAQQRIDLTIAGTAEAPKVSGTGLAADGTLSFDNSKGATITISCGAGYSCANAANTADVETAKLFVAGVKGDLYTINVPSGAKVAKITIPLTIGGKPVTPTLSLTPSTATPTPTTPTGSQSDTPALKARLRNKACSNTVEVTDPNAFVLWLDGTPIQRPTIPPNEGSKITFYVIGDATLVLKNTTVTRKSATRTVLVSNVLGSGTTLPAGADDLNRHGLPVVQCNFLKVQLSDFAPGNGQVEISVVDDDGKTEEENVFEFAITALYTGAFEFGGIYTHSGNPTFAKVFNGTDTVVTQSSDAGRRLLYVLTYTPFIWGRRDVTQPLAPKDWYKAINPVAGVVLNDVANNGIVGVSFNFSSMFSLTGGLHGAHVQQLDPNANVTLGKPFANRGATVPTVKRWIFNPYYGGSIDLAAAVGLLKAAFSAATSTGTGAK